MNHYFFYRTWSCRNSYHGGGQLAAQELSLDHTLSSLWIAISPSKSGILFYMCCRRGKEGYTHIRAGKFYLINCSIIQNGNEGSTEHRAVGLL